MMVILTIGIFAIGGLVIDGGTALAARGRAASLAAQASRAGAGALEPASLRGRSPADIAIDPEAAGRAAQRVLAAGDARGEVSVAGDTVTVTAHVSRRPAILSMVGISTLNGTATATASLVHGSTTGELVGEAP